MKYKLKYLLLALLLCGFANAYSSKPDSIRLSLLTCAPGSEIYAHFGHTAIRYENYTRKIDLVFNYGMFNFREPHFVWRFVKGETDYQLGITPYIYFRAEYAMRGSSVYQQVLNLTQAEKERLVALLEENYRPENRIYRYNYFYDNCTTRARDKIEEAIRGKVVYPCMSLLPKPNGTSWALICAWAWKRISRLESVCRCSPRSICCVMRTMLIFLMRMEKNVRSYWRKPRL